MAKRITRTPRRDSHSEQGRFAFAEPKPRPAKYPENVKATIHRLLDESVLPRDALPYTDEFNRLKAVFQKERGQNLSDADFWQMLSSIGKGGGHASTTGRKTAPRTPSLTEEEQLEMLRLFPDGIGNRDHLPYTAEFDELHRRFGKLTGRKLNQHEFWRSLSRVAKLSRKPKPVFEAAPLGGLPQELVQFLERTNPWWRAHPTRETKRYKRWAFAEVMSRLRSDIAPVVVVRGPRRVGKTTIQEQVIEHLLLIEHVGPQRIMRVQFDDVPGLGVLKNPVEALVRWFEENVLREPINAVARRGEAVYLLFDELQNIAKWSEQLKALVDHTSARTFVTGSSALRIGKARDSLAGRMTFIELGPLRLGEIAGIRGLRDLPPFPESSLESWKSREFWLDLVAFGKKHAPLRDKTFSFFSELGGYPICHTAKDTGISLLRQQIVEEVVTKTIEFDSVRRPHASAIDPRLLRETFRLICRYAGQSVRPTRLAEEIGKVLQATGVTQAKITDAIQFLKDSLLVHAIPPLEMLLKKNDGSPKLCLCDHFVRNGMLQETVPVDPKALGSVTEAVCSSAGHLMESILGYYLKSLPGLDVAWFPSRYNEPEIDVVLTIGTQRIPIEVKYRGKLEEDDLRGLAAFCGKDHYVAPFGLVVTQQTEGAVSDFVVAIPAATFLLVR